MPRKSPLARITWPRFAKLDERAKKQPLTADESPEPRARCTFASASPSAPSKFLRAAVAQASRALPHCPRTSARRGNSSGDLEAGAAGTDDAVSPRA